MNRTTETFHCYTGAMKTIFSSILMLLSCASQITSQTTQCPVNWHQYDGRSNLRTCLWISDEKASWIDALSWCKLMDGFLVEIGSIGLNSYLQNLINMKQTGKYWIGLTDMEMEMQYVWMNAKVRAMETFFIQGGQGGGRAKNCVNMDEKGMWHAENCKAEFSFICQKNA